MFPESGTGAPNTEIDLSPRIDVKLHPFEYYNIVNFKTLPVKLSYPKSYLWIHFKIIKNKFPISRSAFHW